MFDEPLAPAAADTPAQLAITYDLAINFAFQQNSIPVVKELRVVNDGTERRNLVLRISTEPAFALPVEVRLQQLDANGEFRLAPVDLKLGHDLLSSLTERLSGWLSVEMLEGEACVSSLKEPIALLARDEWCGLRSLPEILAAFVQPNDPAVMSILSRAAELLREHTGRGAFNGYQDKSRQRAWDQVAAIYRAIAELGIRYIVAPASFEATGQRIRAPSDIVAQRFGNCLDLTALVAACCEQAGLNPLVLIHEGHAYAGCWLEQQTLVDAADDDLQHIRKLATDELLTVFESTLLATEAPGTLTDAELLARAHLQTQTPFRLSLDVRAARLARILPIPAPGRAESSAGQAAHAAADGAATGLGARTFAETVVEVASTTTRPVTRVDHWRSRLLDLSLRNRLLNFRETKSTIQILSAAPELVEDELAAERVLSLQPKPRIMSESDPRNAATFTERQRSDALLDHLRDELAHGRLHTNLDESEHSRRLTELYRSARAALDENGANTLFAAVGILEWRETEHSDRVLRAPLLLVPVELRRRSVLDGFSLCRIEEETLLNFTLMEMLRQNFRMEIPGLDPLPEDESGVNVARVFQTFRDTVRNLSGWEVKTEIWLGQFSFAKFLLWKDLADRLDALTRNRIVNHLVNEGSAPFPNAPDEITPARLDALFHPKDVYCPRSADSSQLAAVLAAAAGQDFVLEGPPGTGKSQTITNVIAHCLSQGKRVLFVAEKRAALDVVHRRLREDGLEPFCLELHSNKTGKTEVLSQFDRALKYVDSSTTSDWNQRTEQIERLRAALNDYAHTLHRRMPCGLSAYSCLDYLLPRQSEPTVRFGERTNFLNVSAEWLESARATSRVLQERSRLLSPLSEHPLSSVAHRDWSPLWAERAAETIRSVSKHTEVTTRCTADLLAWLGRPQRENSRQRLSELHGLVESLLRAPAVGGAFVARPWHEIDDDLSRWVRLVGDRIQLRGQLASLLPAKAQTTESPCEQWDSERHQRAQALGRAVLQQADSTANATRELRAALEVAGVTLSLSHLHQLFELSESLIAPLDVGREFFTSTWSSWREKLERWTALARERAQLRKALSDYDEARLLALDLDRLQADVRSAPISWFLGRWLRIRRVTKQLASARRDLSPPVVTSLVLTVESALRLRAITAELSSDQALASQHLGTAWNSGEPTPELLTQAASWGDVLHARLAALAGGDSSLQTRISGAAASLVARSGRPADVRLTRFREAFGQFCTSLNAFVRETTVSRASLDAASDHLESVRHTLGVLLPALDRLGAVSATLTAERAAAVACLGELWRHGEPVTDELVNARSWGAVFHSRLTRCAGEDLSWLTQLRHLFEATFTEGSAAIGDGTAVHERLVRFRDSYDAWAHAFDRISAELQLRTGALDGSSDYLPSVAHLLEGLQRSWGKIRDWCSWQKARAQALELGLEPIVEHLEAADGAQVDAPALFERSFRRALLYALIEHEPPLREFFGREHSERIERFRELDSDIARVARDLIRAKLAAGVPQEEVPADIPKAELGLLRKELGKKMRHIPVRQLLGRIPTLLPRLKPCVLMSPLSVAQYLDPTHETFDVVIFDEASQIPVWDAVGAIARGRQLIVVGDPKQLPPTNFFSASEDDEDDRTPEEHKDLESILDELTTVGLRKKRLQWHYRSRHEGLIAFSNRQYYENELLTFPSPDTGGGGVRLVHLPHARYDKGKSRTNRAEALALVDDLVARLRQSDGPQRSIGVVTFSSAQQKLVEDLLDQKRREHPEIERHFGDEPPVEGEPVFVKNLESVQGDERDVILFSICYGPDESGKVSMNFGPLNRDGGERRLNVAVTRAKHEVVVYSGLRADQIDLNRSKATGVRDLKYFLDYADRGPRALIAANTSTSDAEPDSEFERLVAQRIRSAGYTVHHQVGCSGYRVDLAVVDPAAPGRYLLGIECDGATYHRAATARDRDKLRQSILEGLGWKLHRIWSTDWWHDADAEFARVLSAIKSAAS